MMEIEEQKQARVLRRLIVPEVCQTKKPAQNSKHVKIDFYNYQFKAYLEGAKAFSYRCSNRMLCQCLIQIPVAENYDEDFELKTQNIKGLKYINSHTNLCQRKYEESSQLEVREVQVESYKSDSRVLREYIEHFPLQEPKIVQSEMLKQKQRFKKRQIIQMIQDVRNSLFPRDLEMVFTLAIVEQLTLKKQLLIYLNIMDVYLTFQKKVIS